MKSNTTEDNLNTQYTSQENARENKQTNLPLQDGEEQLIKIEPIDGTPFNWITHTGKQLSFIAWGRHRMTQDWHWAKDPQEALVEEHWNVTINLMGFIVEGAMKEK